jgi:hypothetical protein
MTKKLSSYLIAGILAILLIPAKIFHFIYQDSVPNGGKVDLEIDLEVNE